MPQIPEQLSCDSCARSGTVAELAAGWSLSVAPRPTGSTDPVGGQRVGVLCPACARRLVRDLECRLDP